MRRAALPLLLAACYAPHLEPADGPNGDGRFGDGGGSDGPPGPDGAGGPCAVVGLAAGLAHTCAWRADGAVFCWGANAMQQAGVDLGDSCPGGPCLPVPTRLGEVIAAHVSAGDYHTCAIGADGSMVCRGSLTGGPPMSIPGFGGAVAGDGGAGHHCARTTNGSVACFGANPRGQLGSAPNDLPTSPQGSPVPIEGAQLLDSGQSHVCAADAADVRCWGDASNFQFAGTQDCGGFACDFTPQVALSGEVTSLSAGLNHTCAITAGGGVWCWGANGTGQLGDGTMTNRTYPALVSSVGEPAVIVAAGSYHGCAILVVGGRVLCWGLGVNGQLGNGNSMSTTSAVEAPVLGPAVLLAAGTSHTCALGVDGRIRCVGMNAYGQLGAGTDEDAVAAAREPQIPCP